MWGAIIAGLVTLYSNYTARNQQTAATNAALAQEQAANAENQAAITKAQEAAAPALGYFKNVVAQGPTLNQAQRQYVADTRQQTGSALSTRLGGRSATAIASRAATDVSNATTEANQVRADQAAARLADPNISGANLILAAGQSRVADALARANAAREQGATDVGATLASGNSLGSTIGQYYASQANQDLLDAIRRNSAARTSNYPAQQATTPRNPTDSMIF
jgi:hypothetical protein